MLNSRRFRATVSVIALLGLNVQPVWAQGKGGRDAVLNACEAQRAPLGLAGVEHRVPAAPLRPGGLNGQAEQGDGADRRPETP